MNIREQNNAILLATLNRHGAVRRQRSEQAQDRAGGEREMLAFYGILFLGLITYIPAISLWLPNLMGVM